MRSRANSCDERAADHDGVSLQRLSAHVVERILAHGHVLSDAFEVTHGEPVIGGIHGSEAHHFFCAYCMTWMFTRPVLAPKVVNVRPTMFDEHRWFAPYIETYTKTKLPWAVTGAARSFEEFPPMEEYESLIKAFHGAET